MLIKYTQENTRGVSSLFPNGKDMQQKRLDG